MYALVVTALLLFPWSVAFLIVFGSLRAVGGRTAAHK